ncbi:MAG TPA: cation-translocating P-type ATPase [Nitrolancea sp.]|jgi:Cd2+/Zn2+-exporting ATPase|nr:cation-translocating P-type ATPase [Nitrolancea sp.]
MHERTIPVTLEEGDEARCADLLLKTLTSHKGIGAIEFDSEHRAINLKYDPQIVSLVTVDRIAERAGAQFGERFNRCELRMNGVSCRSCAAAIEHRLKGHGEIIWASANPPSRSLSLEYAGAPEKLQQISKDIGETGVSVRSGASPSDGADEEEGWWHENQLMIMAIVTAFFLMIGWGLGALGLISHNVQIAFYVLTYLAGGTFATRAAIEALLQGHVEVDLLMVVAAIGAATIGGWVEGGILLFLFSLGNALEHFALGRTHKAIRSLMELSPEDALVVRNGEERRIPVEELVIGDVVVVRPSERIPSDARVISGESSVDQSPITGESIPVGKLPGDNVFAGTINGHGLLRLSVERVAHESTLAKIIRIVEEARGQKSETQRFTDRFEGAYAIGVICISALTFIIPVAIFGTGEFHSWFYRAMTLLVVASPCALVISTPASILSALANGARQGILFKGAVHLENAGVITAVAFDKTGTLTLGRPRVTDVIPWEGVDLSEMLSIAAAVERLSEHPLGTAVVQYAESGGFGGLIDEGEIADLQSMPGRGVRAQVRGRTIRIGNDALFESEGVSLPLKLREQADVFREDGKTTMYVVADDQPLGVIGVADVIRSVAPSVIQELHRLGIKKTILLTGDNERAARAIARQVGIDEWRAGLLPEEKLDVIRELQQSGVKVAMVGDGVNDAPALATATLGIAMGAAGTDVALETADVVLMSDDLTKLPYAVELSRRARRIITQNMTFALSVIVFFSLGAVIGIVPLPVGVIAHEGGTILVVCNGLRLLRFAKPAFGPAPTPSVAFAGD